MLYSMVTAGRAHHRLQAHEGSSHRSNRARMSSASMLQRSFHTTQSLYDSPSISQPVSMT